MAPGVGIEPTTNALTAHCSTAELPGNVNDLQYADGMILGPARRSSERSKERGGGVSRDREKVYTDLSHFFFLGSFGDKGEKLIPSVLGGEKAASACAEGQKSEDRSAR